MNFNKNDILLVTFPYSDLSNTKKRPALVVKDIEGSNTILCQITTKKRNMSKYEVELKKESCKGDIRFDSFIYVDMIYTLHSSLIIRKIGEITDSKTKMNVDDRLKTLFFE